LTELLEVAGPDVEGRVARGEPVEGLMRGTAGELGVGVDVTGATVESGLFVAAAPEVVEGVNGEGAEAPLPGEFESEAPTAADSVAAAAANSDCLCFSPLTPTATPTMILMRMRATRTIIAMPLFVLYQWYVYDGTGEGESIAVGCVGSSLSNRFVGVSVKGFGP